MKKLLFSAGIAAMLMISARSAISQEFNCPEIFVTNSWVVEGNLGATNNLVFSVHLSRPATQTVTVAYATGYMENGAEPGIDFLPITNGLLQFLPGITNLPIVVAVIGDDAFEFSGEELILELFDPSTNAFLATPEVWGTIMDDDFLMVAGLDVIEPDYGEMACATFLLWLEIPMELPMGEGEPSASVSFTTRDGTAVAGADYVATNGTISLESGQFMTRINVPVLGDIVHESDEYFFLEITYNDPILGPIRKEAKARILDNDFRRLLTIYPTSVDEGQGGENTNNVARFLVTLSQADWAEIVTVDYFAANGTLDKGVHTNYVTNMDGSITTNVLPNVTPDSALERQDFVPTTGTLWFEYGETTQYVEVPIIGNTLEQPDRHFFVVLTNAMNADIYNDDHRAKGTILDDDGFGCTTVSFVSSPALAEGDAGSKLMVFWIQLACSRHTPVRLQYETKDITARAGSDYLGVTNEVVIPNGEMEAGIGVLVYGDPNNEKDETFELRLSSTNASLGMDRGVGTLLNDDPMPFLTISGCTNYEGDAGKNTNVFLVKLSAPSGQEVRVHYESADGTAKVGKDYLRAGGTLKIPALAPYAIIPVTTLGDLEVENDETFFVNLSAPTNVTIAQAQGIGLIQNDDVVRTLSVCDIQVAEGALGQLTDALFYFNLYPSCSVTVQVDFATSDGTAKAGLDYQAKFGTVVFPPGVTTRCVSVQVRGDNTAERDETFFLALTNAVNAVLATNRPAQCTITNDDGLFVPVDHFAWDPIGATQQMYRAFFTTLTAKDATNGTLTNYHSPVTLKVNGYNGAVVSNVLAGLAPSGSMNESVTLGYAFTPSTNLVVTHVRHFTGTKVSFWTSAGELLSNVAVEDMPGVWNETPLEKPLLLLAGTTYRVTCFTGDFPAYWNTALPRTFAYGVINQNYLDYGDGFPAIAVPYQALLDFRYLVVSSVRALNASYSPIEFTNGVWRGAILIGEPATVAQLVADDGDNHFGYSDLFTVQYEMHPMAVGILLGDGGGYQPLAGGARRQVRVSCAATNAYVLEISSNLRQWAPVFTNLTGAADPVLVEPADAHGRFYRARRLP